MFPSGKCAGYFGSKRFDRSVQNNKNNKLHMASVSALLEVSHRIPSLDYTSLMALTWKMTTKAEDLRKMYALMCFNVYAHNRDDHSNNFSFIFDQGKWQLAPAYDLTYSNSMGGEHATTIAGEGRDPELKDLLAVAQKAGIRYTEAKETAERIKDTVEQRLEKYLE